jgi:hypothetical protein
VELIIITFAPLMAPPSTSPRPSPTTRRDSKKSG